MRNGFGRRVVWCSRRLGWYGFLIDPPLEHTSLHCWNHISSIEKLEVQSKESLEYISDWLSRPSCGIRQDNSDKHMTSETWQNLKTDYSWRSVNLRFEGCGAESVRKSQPIFQIKTLLFRPPLNTVTFSGISTLSCTKVSKSVQIFVTYSAVSIRWDSSVLFQHFENSQVLESIMEG